MMSIICLLCMFCTYVIQWLRVFAAVMVHGGSWTCKATCKYSISDGEPVTQAGWPNKLRKLLTHTSRDACIKINTLFVFFFISVLLVWYKHGRERRAQMKIFLSWKERILSKKRNAMTWLTRNNWYVFLKVLKTFKAASYFESSICSFYTRHIVIYVKWFG